MVILVLTFSAISFFFRFDICSWYPFIIKILRDVILVVLIDVNDKELIFICIGEHSMVKTKQIIIILATS